MMTDATDDPTITLRDGDQKVSLARETTPTGERLRIESDDDSTRLDALALESLTWQGTYWHRPCAKRECGSNRRDAPDW
jgi:hypothetical protein